MYKYIIYFHINKTNKKVYVGTTKDSPNYRWGKDGKRYQRQAHFWSAIQKYGWGGFIHIVRHTDLTKEEAENYEKFYISYFRSNDPKYGYNKAEGGYINNLGRDCFAPENIRARQRKYYHNNKEACNERNKKWQEEHKEEIKRRNHEYYLAHKQAMNAKSKEYREQHKEEIKEYGSSYYKTHKDKFLEYGRNAYRRNKEKQ